ncbi:MAG: hypothetical protein Q8O40_09830, partial [Chloroflexota bacterium]|nr:hypothetical protein [Chloroflexota bacterium]
PFSGDFSVELDTTAWAYGQYAFQAVALPLVGAPSGSPPLVKEVAEPRVGVSVSMALVGARSPLALAPGALGYADYTLQNTGNVGVKNIVRKAFFQADAGGTRWPADGNPITDAAILAGGASRRYDNHAVSSAGMAPGSYDAVVYVEFNIDHVKLPGLYAADDRKANELVIGLSGEVGPGLVYLWLGPGSDQFLWFQFPLAGTVAYVGDSPYLAPVWRNTSTVPITGTIVLTITAPSGAQRTPAAISGQGATAAPGLYAPMVLFQMGGILEVGTWTMRAQLYSGTQLLDTVTYTLQVVPQ